MKFEEFKFGRTPHLTEKGASKDDIILVANALEQFLQKPVKIQEKVDGSSIAIFIENGLPKYKHRGGKVIPPYEDFKNIENWYAMHSAEVEKVSQGKYVICGEWLFWQHTVTYEKLPSFLIVYDIFDLEKEKYLSHEKVADKLRGTTICQNPVIFEGVVEKLENLESLMGESLFGAPKKEGLYLRIDGPEYNEQRAKHVSQEFLQSIQERWQPGKPNKSIDSTERYWQ